MAAGKFVGTHRNGRNGPYTGRALQSDPHTNVVFNTQFPLGRWVNVDHLNAAQHKKLDGNPTMAFSADEAGEEAQIGPLPVESDDAVADGPADVAVVDPEPTEEVAPTKRGK